MENTKRVYFTGKEYHAELVKQILDDNGIEAFIINRQDSSYHFGDIEVFVFTDDFEKAKELIDEFENNINLE